MALCLCCLVLPSAVFVVDLLAAKALALYTFPLNWTIHVGIYPTLISKVISCLVKHEHGTVAVLFIFPPQQERLWPFIMGLVEPTVVMPICFIAAMCSLLYYRWPAVITLV